MPLVPRLVLAAALAAAFAVPAGAGRFTGRLDAVEAEIDARLGASPTGKLKKSLKAAAKALDGIAVPTYLTDTAALVALAEGVDRVYKDPSDPIHGLLVAAFDGLQADVYAENGRLARQYTKSLDEAVRAAGKKAFDAAKKALQESGEEERAFSSRAGRVAKAIKIILSARKKLGLGQPEVCDAGGSLIASIGGRIVSPNVTGGEFTRDPAGNLLQFNVVSITTYPTTLRFSDALTIFFNGAAFQGVGVYPVTASGAVTAKWIPDTQPYSEFLATEGTVEVTSWDPVVRRVEGTFTLKTVDGGGQTTFEATGGAFLVCAAYQFTRP